jgi:hypothetical protein
MAIAFGLVSCQEHTEEDTTHLMTKRTKEDKETNFQQFHLRHAPM